LAYLLVCKCSDVSLVLTKLTLFEVYCTLVYGCPLRTTMSQYRITNYALHAIVSYSANRQTDRQKDRQTWINETETLPPPACDGSNYKTNLDSLQWRQLANINKPR